jgi:uncharacterized repeat protein (TIGR01451 family)
VSPTLFQCQGGDPVNFEIELRADGTIVKRYGPGNNNLKPVVGISAGERDSYFIASHSSSTGTSLNNAGTVTYRLRNSPKTADVRITSSVTPTIVRLGTQATLRVTVSNLGPNTAAGVRVQGALPSQLSFVSCTPSAGTCWAIAGVGETKINAEIGELAANASATVDVVATLVGATNPFRIFEVNTGWGVSDFTFDPTSSNSSSLKITGTNPNPNPLLGATAIAAGAEHGLALVGGNSLASWGQNQSSQLGDWPFIQRSVAGVVNGISNVVQVDGGGGHTIARTSDDRVWTWGNNLFGQLGDGTTSNKRGTPQAVPGLTGVIAVEAGQGFSLALRSNGTVASCGHNDVGQLGDGSTTDRLQPVDVSGLTNITRISAGNTHALALKNDGTVWSWGHNERGKLGDGTETTRTTPVQVLGLAGIVRISAGGLFSLAVDGNGRVWSWGNNQSGALGDGTTQFRTTPVQVVSLTNVAGISAGSEHAVALLNDGTVWSWGRNANGALGQLLSVEFKTTPGPVVFLTGVTAVAAGEGFTLALHQSGKIAAWGNDNWGQLGTGEGSGGGIAFPYDIAAIPPAPPPTTVQLARTTFNSAENSHSVRVEIERTGDTTTSFSVDFATVDTAGANPCNVINGQASSRCDYMKTIGTMTFEPGGASRFVDVPIVNDIYTEGTESFTIMLLNVKGALMGANSSATLTITDFGPEGTTNPIDQASFFVRQHYFDFLNRPSDSSGESFWTNEITSCGNDQACISAKRVNVSAAFFLSIEFRQTGFFAYRMYKASFGNLPNAPVPLLLNDFVRDTRVIGGGVQVGVGNWQQQLETNKVAFTQAFVQRLGFVGAYPSSMTAEEFVDKLNTNAGGALSATERNNLVAVLGSTPSDVVKRAQVVRAVTEDTDLANAESNRAFVLMQYFGYLRRNPNDLPDGNFDGYNFWLGKLNQFNGNFVEAEMVKAFLVSAEYRHRFGP